jgi:hypothetical protein
VCVCMYYVYMYALCMYVLCIYVYIMYVRMYVSSLMRAIFPASLIFNDMATLITGLYVPECVF